MTTKICVSLSSKSEDGPADSRIRPTSHRLKDLVI